MMYFGSNFNSNFITILLRRKKEPTFFFFNSLFENCAARSFKQLTTQVFLIYQICTRREIEFLHSCKEFLQAPKQLQRTVYANIFRDRYKDFSRVLNRVVAKELSHIITGCSISYSLALRGEATFRCLRQLSMGFTCASQISCIH